MEEKKNNKKFILVLIGIIGVCLIALGITYAYWTLTKQQTGENVVNTACLNITFTGENDIQLDKAYPLQPEELEKFLSTATPYHFTIHNECSDLASASINLESLTVSGKALEDEYIDAILYEDDYNTNLNTNKKLTTPNDENKVIADAKHAYSLYNFTLKASEEKDFNLLLYMDSETPMEDANMNASWKGKITLSAGYKEDSKTIRKISDNDNNGMWSYKDKITKIVIEDSKSVKEAPDEGKVYGPFDESEYGTNAIQSYVVCEADETNCIGYLQSDGKVKANSDSSYLFSNFSNIVEIEKLENLDTSQTVNMFKMFNGCSNLSSLDLSTFDTTILTNTIKMFSGCSSLQNLDLSNWKFNNSITKSFTGASSLNECELLENIILNNIDTSNVTLMTNMFMGLIKVNTLDLSSFDTSHVTSISGMFTGSTGLHELNLSNWDLSNLDKTSSSNMFSDNSNLETINMTNFIFPPNSSYFFSGRLTALDNIILDNCDTTQVTNMSYMFDSLNITNINLKSFDTQNVTNMVSMFSNLKNIKTLDLSMFDTSHVTNMSYIFNNISELTELNLSNWDFSSLTSAPNMYASSNISTINMTNAVFPINSSEFFSGLSTLSNIILDNCDTTQVTDMSKMFYACFGLNSLDLSSFDTNNVLNMNNMFSGAIKLQSITFGSKFVHKSDATTSSMFNGCPAPERPTGDTWSDVIFD